MLVVLDASRAASITLHHSHDSSSATAISHQSFVQHMAHGALATPSNSEQLPLAVPVQLKHASSLATPTLRIINTSPQLERALETSQLPLPLQLNAHTPAELTYAAHPIVHQMLPQIKPVRNLSYAALRPTPRRERERHDYVVYAH